MHSGEQSVPHRIEMAPDANRLIDKCEEGDIPSIRELVDRLDAPRKPAA